VRQALHGIRLPAEYQSEVRHMVTAVMNSPAAKKKATRFFRTEGLPKGFEWVEMLNPLNYRLFVIDLYEALAKVAIHEASADSIVELLDDWKATAEVDTNPQLVAHLRTSRDEKTYRDWECR